MVLNPDKCHFQNQNFVFHYENEVIKNSVEKNTWSYYRQ